MVKRWLYIGASLHPRTLCILGTSIRISVSFPRERDPAGNVYQGNYFEELVYAIVVSGWISTRAGLQAENFGQELTLQVTSRILFFFREKSVLLSKSFNWLDEVYSHYGGLSPLFKVNWCKQHKKCLHSNT